MNSSKLGDRVPIYKSWLEGLDQFMTKWMVKWIQYLFYDSLHLKRRDGWWCTSDDWLNWLWTFNIGIYKYQGKFLVHNHCRGIKGMYDFLTISCIQNWGLDNLNVNSNKMTFDADRVSKWTIRLLLLHGCFLKKYLAW